MINLAQLQQEVYAWSSRNFPNATTEDPMVGMFEELGELAHAYLKTKQGIRGTKEEHHAAMCDAVADLIVFFLDYSVRAGIKLYEQQNYFKAGADVYAGTIPSIGMFLGNLASSHIYSKECQVSAFNVYMFLHCIGQFCRNHDIDLELELYKTWQEVKQRDWLKFPKNGRTE
jgi:NTP pyrophosphatase (non-canonical NTP hydrolase)